MIIYILKIQKITEIIVIFFNILRIFLDYKYILIIFLLMLLDVRQSLFLIFLC